MTSQDARPGAEALARALHGSRWDDGWNPVVADGGHATLDCELSDHDPEAVAILAALSDLGYSVEPKGERLDQERLARAIANVEWVRGEKVKMPSRWFDAYARNIAIEYAALRGKRDATD